MYWKCQISCFQGAVHLEIQYVMTLIHKARVYLKEP